MGTIAAVVMILVFLVWVAAPLFGGATVGRPGDLGPAALVGSTPVAAGADELGLLGWTLDARGDLALFTIAGGERLARRKLFPAPLRPTAWSFAPDSTSVACGFQDGSVRVGRIAFTSRYLEGGEIPPALRTAKSGTVALASRGVARVTPGHQVRLQELAPPNGSWRARPERRRWTCSTIRSRPPAMPTGC